MDINLLGVVGAILMVIIFILVVIVVYKSRPSHDFVIITDTENQKFLEDSIAIQPNNRPIFQGENIDDVIQAGISIMQEESYNILEGVEDDGI